MLEVLKKLLFPKFEKHNLAVMWVLIQNMLWKVVDFGH